MGRADGKTVKLRSQPAAPLLILAGLLLSVSTSGQSDAEAQPTSQTPPEEPRDLGIEEKTGRRLVQIDVSVTGPRGAIEDLRADDFEIVVGGKNIDGLIVDRICREPDAVVATEPAEPKTEERVEDEPVPPPPASPPVTFLFYFDQAFLTMEGRNRSLDTAKQLIPELVVNGNRGMVVSSGLKVMTLAKLTTDVGELIDGVDGITQHPGQWDSSSAGEELHIAEMLRALEKRGVEDAARVARHHQVDELWRTAKALRRFSMVLGRFAGLDPPKVVVYFADRMRKRPGEYYLSYFSHRAVQATPTLQKIELDAFRDALNFDRVVDEANAHAVRVYTVQAEGMTGTSSITPPSRIGSSTRYITDAQDSLAVLAGETGGEAFLRGIRWTKIARKIKEDLNCLYLISFDPEGLPEDRGLNVIVRVNRRKVQANTRGQTVIQSESARLTSRLMAAFSTDVIPSDPGLYGVVTPTGFVDGKYTALVQVSVAGSPLGGVTWDVGASLVSRGKVQEDAAGRITVGGPGISVVFETEMEFAPGEYELVLVAHDTTTNQISNANLEGTFPNPNDGPATVVPISVMQPAVALFLRDGEVQKSGALGQEAEQLLRPDLPTSLISLVCRGKRQKGKLQVERNLVGISPVEFSTLELDLGDDRCTQIRDVIPAGTLTEGEFAYEVQVVQQDETLATEVRRFFIKG